MNKSTRLKSIILSDFRGFGKDHCIELPEGAGVTILSGANGLGKSTVLEAIEWTLTGDIQRLKNLTGGNLDLSTLCRRGAFKDGIHGKYFTQLIFSTDKGQKTLTREVEKSINGQYQEITVAPTSEILDCLVTNNWNVPYESLGTYLHLTHLQSQSSSIRFSGLDPKEQWQRFRGLAGLDRLSIAQERIGNTTRAFNDEFNRRTKDKELAEQALSYWSEILQKRDLFQKRLEAEVGLSPQEALSSLRSILPPDIPFNEQDECQLDGVRTLINITIEQLNIKKKQIDYDLKRMESFNDLPKKLRELNESLSLLKEKQDKLNERINENQSLINGQRSQNQDNQKILNDTLLALEQASLELEVCQNTKHILGLNDNIQKQIEDLNSIFQTDSEIINTVESKLETLNEQFHQRKTLSFKYTAIQDNLKELEDLKKRINAYSEMLSQVKKQKVLKNTLNEMISQKQFEIGKLDENLKHQNQALANKTRIINETQQQVNEIHKALSIIINHVQHDDSQCPLCSTTFVPGVLYEQIKLASLNINPYLLQFQDEAKEIKESIDKSNSLRQSYYNDLSKKIEEVRIIELFEQRIEVEYSELMRHPIIVGLEMNDHLESIKIKQAQLLKDQLEILSELSNCLDESVLKEEIAEKKAILEQLNQKQQNSKNELDKLKRDKSINLATLKNLSGTIVNQSISGDWESNLEKLYLNIEKLKEDVKILNQKKEKVLAEIEKLENILEVDAVKKTSIQEELTALQNQKDFLLSSWREQKADVEPNEVEIENIFKQLRQQLSDIVLIIDKVLEAHKKLEIWNENQDLNFAKKQIENILITEKTFSEKNESQRREGNLLIAKKRLEQFQEAREGIDWLKAQLSQETSRYTRDVLGPLNDLLNKFLVALTSDKKWRIENDARITTSHKAELKTQILWGNVDENTQSVAANQILSEGQMSAVTLAQLLSMSSAYQWSNWRALLLDDPTQHNDLIRVASFIEVLRNLVLYQDYQIILCTHDLEEASFIKRKLQASEIKVNEINFLGHSASGVRTEKMAS